MVFDPDPEDPDLQVPELQDPDLQEPELQDPDLQEPEPPLPESYYRRAVSRHLTVVFFEVIEVVDEENEVEDEENEVEDEENEVEHWENEVEHWENEVGHWEDVLPEENPLPPLPLPPLPALPIPALPLRERIVFRLAPHPGPVRPGPTHQAFLEEAAGGGQAVASYVPSFIPVYREEDSVKMSQLLDVLTAEVDEHVAVEAVTVENLSVENVAEIAPHISLRVAGKKRKKPELASKMVEAIRDFTAIVERDGVHRPVLDAQNGEELMHVQPGVSIVLGSHPPESPGTLYISTKQVIWLSDTDRAKGYAVGFLSISLHAVSRDPETYTSPCIYAQFETGADEDESEGSDSKCIGVLDLSKITEMRLVPSDPNQLDSLFDVFCECAELNPESFEENEEEEEEEEHNWIFSAEQLEDEAAGEASEPSIAIGQSNGDHDLARTVLELQINDQRFEDAEETDSAQR